MISTPIIQFLIGLLLAALHPVFLPAQQHIDLASAEQTALEQHLQLAVNAAEITSANYAVRAARDIPKTGVFAENEDLRPSDSKGILKIGISQGVAWPGLYAARKKYFEELLQYAQLNTASLRAVIRRDVRSAYYQLWYLQDRQTLYKQLDSLYTGMYQAAGLRVKAGDAPVLDRVAAEARMKELRALLQQNERDMIIQQRQLMLLLNSEMPLLPVDRPLEKRDLPLPDDDMPHPLIALQQQNAGIAAAHVNVQKNSNKPEFAGRFFSQRLWAGQDPFTGFSVTASFPLLGTGAYKNKVRQAEAEQQVQEAQLSLLSRQLDTQKQTAQLDVEKSVAMLQFYEETGLEQAAAIIEAATLSYHAGETGFAELSLFLNQAIGIRQSYLEVLNEYNHSVIRLDYLEHPER